MSAKRTNQIIFNVIGILLTFSLLCCSTESGETGGTDDVSQDVADVGEDLADEDSNVADLPVEDVGRCDLEDEIPETPGRVQLENGMFGCDNVLLAPDPGEEGYLAASRLTPPDYPFVVSAIAYPLGHGPSGEVTCNGSFEHHVFLFASEETTPSAEPVVSVDLVVPSMPAEEVSDEGRYVYIELDEPMTLTEGEHLFVAVPLLGTHPDVMCIAVDTESEGGSDRNYWSSANEPPYSWVRLDSFGLVGNILAVAIGFVEE